MRIPKRYANNFFQKIEAGKNSGHVKYRCRIIGRRISIEALWKFFHLNTPNQKVNS